jgi:hypothetical protein
MLVYMTVTILSQQQHLGKAFCYYGYFNMVYVIAYSQLQSFFVAFFRYLCIVHNNSLASIGMTAKVIKKKVGVLRASHKISDSNPRIC